MLDTFISDITLEYVFKIIKKQNKLTIQYNVHDLFQNIFFS